MATRSLTPGAGALLGSLAAFVVAGALVPLRSGMGNTNVALVLVVVVVGAATVGGRQAGAATSVMAAISYNFFHTEPYRSLRVDAGEDVITVALLVVVGLVVGEIAVRSTRVGDVAAARLGGITSVHRVSELIGRGGPADAVTDAVEREVASLCSASLVPLRTGTGPH